jgi:hypothetical protein
MGDGIFMVATDLFKFVIQVTDAILSDVVFDCANIGLAGYAV